MKPAAEALTNVISVEEFTEAQKAHMREELRLKNERERAEYEHRRWLGICPPIYDQELDYSKLKSSNHKAIKGIVSWPAYPKGFFLIGPTGQGKTRACWAAIKPHFMAGKSVRAKSSFQVAQDAVAALTDHDRAKSIMASYLESDILFLDDVGKRLTPSACQFLFEIIERRTSNDRPLVCTSNETMRTLAQGIGDSTMAEPIIRRLEEFCDVGVLA